jgi:integrase
MQYVMTIKGVTAKSDIDDCYMFTCNQGNPFTPIHLGYTLEKILRKHKFPHASPRDLRHIFTSMCVNSGIRVNQLQEYLGHAYGSTTMDYYVHSDEQRNKHEIVKLEQNYIDPSLVNEFENMKLALLK